MTPIIGIAIVCVAILAAVVFEVLDSRGVI
jgi:hypothetical protein